MSQQSTHPKQTMDPVLFAKLTGDDHPIHYDAEYAKQTRFGKPVAHGLLLMAHTALGATTLTRHVEDAIIAFVGQDCRFLKPVVIGDHIRSERRPVATSSMG